MEQEEIDLLEISFNDYNGGIHFSFLNPDPGIKRNNTEYFIYDGDSTSFYYSANWRNFNLVGSILKKYNIEHKIYNDNIRDPIINIYDIIELYNLLPNNSKIKKSLGVRLGYKIIDIEYRIYRSEIPVITEPYYTNIKDIVLKYISNHYKTDAYIDFRFTHRDTSKNRKFIEDLLNIYIPIKSV